MTARRSANAIQPAPNFVTRGWGTARTALRGDRIAKVFLPRREVVGDILLLLAGALVLGFFRIDHQSFSLDESSSVFIARRDPADLWRVLTRIELNGSLYYALLHAWMQLWGTGEAAVRSLSALAAAGAVPFVYLTGRRLLSRGTALIGSALLFLNPFFISFAQEARGYALVLLLTSIATFLFARGLTRPSWWTWLTYAGFAAIAVYAHFFAGLMLLAHGAAFIALRPPGVRWRPVLWAYSIAGVAIFPAARFAVFTDNAACRTAYLPSLSLDELGIVARDLAGNSDMALIAVGAAVCAALVALVVMLARRNARWHPLGLLAILVAVPLAATLVISVAKPLLFSKYLIIVLPSLSLLAAAGVMILRFRSARLAAVAVIVAIWSLGLTDWYTEPRKEDWRSAAQLVLAGSSSQDALIAYQRFGRPGHAFAYYVEQLGGAEASPQLIALPIASDYLADGQSCAQPAGPAFEAAVRAQVSAVARETDRLFLMVRRTRDDPNLSVVLGAITEHYREVESTLLLFSYHDQPDQRRWYPGLELRIFVAHDARTTAVDTGRDEGS